MLLHQLCHHCIIKLRRRSAGYCPGPSQDLDQLLALREYVRSAFEEDMGKDKTPKVSARLRKAAAAFIAYLLDMLGEVPPAGSASIFQSARQLDSGMSLRCGVMRTA